MSHEDKIYTLCLFGLGSGYFCWVVLRFVGLGWPVAGFEGEWLLNFKNSKKKSPHYYS